LLKKKEIGVPIIVSGGDKTGDHQVSDRPQVKRVPVKNMLKNAKMRRIYNLLVVAGN